MLIITDHFFIVFFFVLFSDSMVLLLVKLPELSSILLTLMYHAILNVALHYSLQI